MKEKIVKVGKALKKVAKDEKTKRDFLHACNKLKKKHEKVNDCRLKMLKVLQKEMDAIGIPVTTEEKELMTEAIGLYDKTLQELKDDINRFREYLELGER
jgi:hypothetical protein